MMLNIIPSNIDIRQINKVVDCLKNNGIIIYPTDTVYGIGTSIYNKDGVFKICKIKNILPQKAQLSFICNDLSHLSKFTKSISTPIYRMLKQYLPGPFTFILPASKDVPFYLLSKNKTIALRIPNNPICLNIVKAFNEPILSALIPGSDIEELTDPNIIYEKIGSQVDIMINGGNAQPLYSTIIDCTEMLPKLIRQGLGEWQE